MSKLGFNVVYNVVNFVNYEVSQRRRIIIIGTKYCVIFEYPKIINKILTMNDTLQNIPKSDTTRRLLD